MVVKPQKRLEEGFERIVAHFMQEVVDKRSILLMESLGFNEGFVKLLSQAGIYAMAYREWEYMDILNFEEVKHV